MTSSWVAGADASYYPVTALPYAVAADESGTRVVTRIGDFAVGLPQLHDAGLVPAYDVWRSPTLDGLLAAGPAQWQATRDQLTAALTDPAARDVVEPLLEPVASLRLVEPFTVADYVDFYASEHHASNLGRILRPGQEPLLPNWKHLPVGYHGRSGTVVVSGTPVMRPCGQRRGDAAPEFGPSQRLDVEAEVGFVVGTGTAPATAVSVDEFANHVFGVCLVNDWSARDIQAWEYQPLGPFLGKSFATSVSAWVTPLAALTAARCPVESQRYDLMPYLREAEPWGLDITLELAVNGTVLSRPPYRTMFWSPAQMLAHLTVNGARLRTGDLFASGTVSGPAPEQWGSLIEIYANERFLDDGDEVVISATAPDAGGTTISVGEVRGTVVPARL